MLLFGHLGITLGAGILLRNALTKSPILSIESQKVKVSPQSSSTVSGQDFTLGNRTDSPTPLGKHMDYRLLLIVGSLLPDLIDKPIGGILFYETFQNSRIFSHTLCFVVCLAALGVYLYKSRRKAWFLILSFGSALHLILDQMWLSPHTLFWPVYGWSFDKVDSVTFFQWLPEMFHTLVTDASVYIPEIIGFGILAWFVVKLARMKRIYAFITNGLAE